jgi:hypothetical protein
MVRPAPSGPWSPRSQQILIRAVRDQDFMHELQSRGIPPPSVRTWARSQDVPASVRSQLRGLLEDWAHAHPGDAVGLTG